MSDTKHPVRQSLFSTVKVDSIFDEMNSVFDELFNADLFFKGREALPLSAVSTRSHTVVADEKGLAVSVDLPGVRHEDVKVQTEGDEFEVRATRAGKETLYRYRVSQAYDPATVMAHLEDGVLTVTFAKRVEQQPRAVEVFVSRKG